MKSYFNQLTILFIISILIICSCNKPNLDGHWHVYYAEYGEETGHIWDIRNDSLIPFYDNPIGPDSFHIGYDKIKFTYTNEEYEYDYDFFGDSCFLYLEDTLSLILKRKDNCRPYNHWISLEVNLELPEFGKDRVKLYNEEGSFNDVTIYIGEPLNKRKKGLVQLNDGIYEYFDIVDFLYGCSVHGFPQVKLLVDKNIKLNYLNKVLLELRIHHYGNIGFLFNVSENSLNLGEIKKRLLPIGTESKYYPDYKNDSLLSIPPPPPPPPPWFSIFNAIKKEAFKFNLKNDSLFCNQKPIEFTELQDTLSKYFSTFNFKQKEVNVMFEWDTASVFNTYAVVSVLLENVKKNYRNDIALRKHNKPFKELDEQRKMELMKQYRVNFIEITPADRHAIDKKNIHHR